jgi:hypothetical protein
MHTNHPNARRTRRPVPHRRRRDIAGLAVVLGLGALTTACGSQRDHAAVGSFCDTLATSSRLASGLGSSSTSSADLVAAFEQLTQLAPAQLRPDVQIVSDAMAHLATLGTDDAGGISAAVDVVLSPEVASATERIGTYAVSECGITPVAWTTGAASAAAEAKP